MTPKVLSGKVALVTGGPRGIGRPEDIAGVVVFLATPAARWISGQCLPVNGGFA